MSIFILRHKECARGKCYAAPTDVPGVDWWSSTFEGAQKFATVDEALESIGERWGRYDILQVSWILRWNWGESAPQDDLSYVDAEGLWTKKQKDAKRFDSAKAARTARSANPRWAPSKDDLNPKAGAYAVRLTKAVRP